MNEKKDAGTSLLENAYALETPVDNVNYYREFAASYDTDFRIGMGYTYPAAIARVFVEHASDADLPIIDIGCGTGLVASELLSKSEKLPKPIAENIANNIDGADISAEMLDKARHKKLYRDLHEVDLSKSTNAIANSYGAVISAGTFTHGHLGPGPLAALLDVAKSDALFVIGVNKQHFSSNGFAAVLDELQTNRKISPYTITDVPIYAEQSHEHAEDRGWIVTYRKT